MFKDSWENDYIIEKMQNYDDIMKNETVISINIDKDRGDNKIKTEKVSKLVSNNKKLGNINIINEANILKKYPPINMARHLMLNPPLKAYYLSLEDLGIPLSKYEYDVIKYIRLIHFD